MRKQNKHSQSEIEHAERRRKNAEMKLAIWEKRMKMWGNARGPINRCVGNTVSDVGHALELLLHCFPFRTHKMRQRSRKLFEKIMIEITEMGKTQHLHVVLMGKLWRSSCRTKYINIVIRRTAVIMCQIFNISRINRLKRGSAPKTWIPWFRVRAPSICSMARIKWISFFPCHFISYEWIFMDSNELANRQHGVVEVQLRSR